MIPDEIFDTADAISPALTEVPQTPSALARKAHVSTPAAHRALRWMAANNYAVAVGNGAWTKYRTRRFGEIAMSTFACDTCYDTFVIDHAGAEVPCPDCQFVEIKLTGLSHGGGGYALNYTTAVAHTATTITFRAPTRAAILADARRVRDAQVGIAKRNGRKGRNAYSSWAIAILKRLAAS